MPWAVIMETERCAQWHPTFHRSLSLCFHCWFPVYMHLHEYNAYCYSGLINNKWRRDHVIRFIGLPSRWFINIAWAITAHAHTNCIAAIFAWKENRCNCNILRKQNILTQCCASCVKGASLTRPVVKFLLDAWPVWLVLQLSILPHMTVFFDPSAYANALQMPWQRVLVIIQATKSCPYDFSGRIFNQLISTDLH